MSMSRSFTTIRKRDYIPIFIVLYINRVNEFVVLVYANGSNLYSAVFIYSSAKINRIFRVRVYRAIFLQRILSLDKYLMPVN